MSAPPEIPRFPRLGDHVAARKHVVGGEACVILYDTRSERQAQLGLREWTLLSCADGTRDPDGILEAAARLGRYAKREHLAAFLAQLGQAGLLAPAEAEAEPRPELPPGAAGRALDVLADFTLSCDGGGSCCRIYPTTLFAPLEVVRARALAPEVLDAGEWEHEGFTPERGSSARPAAPPDLAGRAAAAARGGSCVALIDGRCAYLLPDRTCLLHRRGGAAGKPRSCQLFPVTFVDDGEVVRVSVAPECSCVFTSLQQPGRGEPLVPAQVRRRDELDAAVFVAQLPESISGGAGRRIPRADYRRWSQRAAAQIPLLEPERDAPAWLLGLAAAVERGDLADPDPPPVSGSGLPRVLAPWQAQLRRRRQRDAWRSEADLAQQSLLLLRDAAAALGGASQAPPAAAPGAEWFYVRALLHGHLLPLDHQPLGTALRERAYRLLIARAAERLRQQGWLAAHRCDETDPVFEQPLALVEALTRGHGLAITGG